MDSHFLRQSRSVRSARFCKGTLQICMALLVYTQWPGQRLRSNTDLSNRIEKDFTARVIIKLLQSSEE